VGGTLVLTMVGLWLFFSRRADQRVQAAAQRRRDKAAEDMRRTLEEVKSAAGRSADVSAWTREYPFGSSAAAAILGALAGARFGSRRRRSKRRRDWDDEDDDEDEDDDDRPRRGRRRRAGAAGPLMAMMLPLVERFVTDWLAQRAARNAAAAEEAEADGSDEDEEDDGPEAAEASANGAASRGASGL
jgi:hypothetical protein